jgi:hypothetical protein
MLFSKTMSYDKVIFPSNAVSAYSYVQNDQKKKRHFGIGVVTSVSLALIYVVFLVCTHWNTLGSRVMPTGTSSYEPSVVKPIEEPSTVDNDVDTAVQLNQTNFVNDGIPVLPHEWTSFKRQIFRKAMDKVISMPGEVGAHLGPQETFQFIPTTYDCPRDKLVRLGHYGDTTGWVCLTNTDLQEGCNVVTAGYNDNFNFENAIHEYSGGKCHIYFFDCDFQEDHKLPEFVTHYPYCLDAENFDDHQGRQYRNWDYIVDEMQVGHVDYMKIDADAYEWSVLPDIFKHSEKVGSVLPKQIAFELHIVEQAEGHIQQPEDTPKELVAKNNNFLSPIARLFKMADSAGYLVASSEFVSNYEKPCCNDFVLVRDDEELHQ